MTTVGAGESIYPLGDLIAKSDLPFGSYISESLDSLLAGLYYNDAEAFVAGRNFVLRLTLLFAGEIVLSPPGTDAIALVVAPGPPGWSALKVEAVIGPAPSLALIDVPVALRFSKDVLADATGKGAEIAFTASLRFEADMSLHIDTDASLSLPECEIAGTGVKVSATELEWNFQRGQTIPDAIAAGIEGEFIGVAFKQATLKLPETIKSAPSSLIFDYCCIGTGGFTGGIAATLPSGAGWDQCTVGGFEIQLQRVGIRFQESRLVMGEIEAKLHNLAFFDTDVAVDLQVREAKGLRVSLSTAHGRQTSPNATVGNDGFLSLTKPNVISMSLTAATIEVSPIGGLLRLSGTVKPLVKMPGGDSIPDFKVDALTITSAGKVSVEGGWISLPKATRVKLGPFAVELTKVALGTDKPAPTAHDPPLHFVGFSGTLRLVEGVPVTATLDGLKIRWNNAGFYDLQLIGIGLSFTVAGVLGLDGSVRYDPVAQRFDGHATLVLISLNLTVSVRVVIGRHPLGDYNYLYIYLLLQPSFGTPIFNTGLAFYSLEALYARHMRPDKKASESWYEDWYRRPPLGAVDTHKWEDYFGSQAFGAGVIVGTVPDKGYSVGVKGLLIIIVPGPVLMLESRANLLKDPSELAQPDKQALFNALAIYDGNAGTLQLDVEPHYMFPDAGELVDVSGIADAFYSFNDPRAWHVYIGRREKTHRIRARVLKIFDANFYLMVLPDSLEIGAFIGYDKHLSFGPVDLTLQALIEGSAFISWRPKQAKGTLHLQGTVKLSVCGVGLGVSASAELDAQAPQPYLIDAEVHVKADLPWPIPGFDVTVHLHWETPGPPRLTVPLQSVGMEHLATKASWLLDGSAPVVPLDGRLSLAFDRPVNDSVRIGTNLASAPDFRLGDYNFRTNLEGLEVQVFDANANAWTTYASPSGTPKPLYGMWQLQDGDAGQGSRHLMLSVRTPYEWSRALSEPSTTQLEQAQGFSPCEPVTFISQIDFNGVPNTSFPGNTTWLYQGVSFEFGPWDGRIAEVKRLLDVGTQARLLSRYYKALFMPDPVSVVLTSITVTPAGTSIDVSSSLPFTAIGTYSDGSTMDLTPSATWVSSSTAVATISDVAGTKGLATAAQMGPTTISATSAGITGSTTLYVGHSSSPVTASLSRPSTAIPAAPTVPFLRLEFGANLNGVTFLVHTHGLWQIDAFDASGTSLGHAQDDLPDSQLSQLTIKASGIRRVDIAYTHHMLLLTVAMQPAPSDVDIAATKVAMQQTLERFKSSEPVFDPHRRYRLHTTTSVVETGGADLTNAQIEQPPGSTIVISKSIVTVTQDFEFQTQGPPGDTTLAPLGPAAEAVTGLDTLEPYIKYFVPPRGAPAVYRDYDLGVAFNTDYVDRIYRSNVDPVARPNGQTLVIRLHSDQDEEIAVSNTLGKGNETVLRREERTWVNSLSRAKCQLTINETDIVRETVVATQLTAGPLAPRRRYEAVLAGDPPGPFEVTKPPEAAKPLHRWSFISSIYLNFRDHFGLRGPARIAAQPITWTSWVAAIQSAAVAGDPWAVTGAERERRQAIETSAFGELFAQIQVERSLPPDLELHKIVSQGDVVAFLISSPEPFDWERLRLTVEHLPGPIGSDPTLPRIGPPPPQPPPVFAPIIRNGDGTRVLLIPYLLKSVAYWRPGTYRLVGTFARTAGNGLAPLSEHGDATSEVGVLNVVVPALVSIALTPANSSLAKGLDGQFTATGTYSDASTSDLTAASAWASSSTAAVSISSTGLAHAVSPGLTTISATLGSVVGSTGLTVTPAALVSIAVTPASTSLVQGLDCQFTAIGIYTDASTVDVTATSVWASSRVAVASISSVGLAHAVGPGATTISATLGSVVGSTGLIVTPALVSIAVTPANSSLAMGLDSQLTATGTYTDASVADLTASATWVSSSTAVAFINSTGRVHGVSPGATTVSARLGSVVGSTGLTVHPAKIAFTSTRDGNSAIFTMNPDGSGQIRLTAFAIDSNPTWSPDGKRIAFSSTRTGSGQIFTMNDDGTGVSQLTSAGENTTPAWSADGSKIAFTSTRDGNPEIYVMNPNGSGQLRLTKNPAIDTSPSWSPDGRQIAFSSTRTGSGQIFTMTVNGTLSQLTSAGENTTPAWSPDRSKIAFTSTRDGNPEIYVMDTKGSQVRLTNNPAIDSIPTWSPDGKKIAFSSTRTRISQIFTMNADGTGVIQLTSAGLNTAPAWGLH